MLWSHGAENPGVGGRFWLRCFPRLPLPQNPPDLGVPGSGGNGWMRLALSAAAPSKVFPDPTGLGAQAQETPPPPSTLLSWTAGGVAHPADAPQRGMFVMMQNCLSETQPPPFPAPLPRQPLKSPRWGRCDALVCAAVAGRRGWMKRWCRLFLLAEDPPPHTHTPHA